ncbi:hypothetical protein EIP86_007276 [Pleurotus ostreatoroseus]|nr:hypothetical protein EIP86_007276 [Pleurotus ostreatoroseus]
MIDLLQDSLERWLNPHSRQPVFMIKALSTDNTGATLNPDIIRCGGWGALEATLQCILTAGRKFDALSVTKGKSIVPNNPPILWTDDENSRDYPEPDLSSIWTNPAHRKASLLILRHPTMYDEDTGLLLERVFRSRQLPETLKCLRRVWNRGRFSVPREWVTPGKEEEVDFSSRCSLYNYDPARDLLHKLTATTMNDLRQHLVIASSDTLLQNHLTKTYCGPDFLLSRQLLRSKYRHHTREVIEDPTIDTHAHMYRTYDFIQLSTSGWHDFNILVAKLFSGFASYSVQW